jgi:hypothetical protein
MTSARDPGKSCGSLFVGALETLIEQIGLQGLRINNLFQIETGWRANLTDGHVLYAFGEGPNAIDALRGAVDRTGKKALV